MSELKLTLIESEGGYKVTAADQNGNLRIQVYGAPSEAKTGRMVEIAQQYARRIVACVNACEGVPTEVLEAYTVLEKLREKDAQRDELLAALEKAFPELDKIDRHCLGWPFVSEPVEILRAAIARAKGGAA